MVDAPEPSDNLQQLLAGYVLNDLTPEEMAQVEAWLGSDPTLAAEVRRLQSILAVFPLALPEAKPSPTLAAQILQAAQAAPPQPKARRRGIPTMAKWLAVGSAAALIAGLSLQVVHLRRQLATTRLEQQALQDQLATAQSSLEQIRQNDLPQTRQQLSRYQAAVSLLRQPDNRYFTMKGMVPEMPSTGSLVIAPTMASAILVLRGVAALPEDQVYRMWAVMDGRKVACGDFRPNPDGDVFLQLPVDQWGATPEVVITVEPTVEMPEPVGEMVMVGS